MKRFMKLVCCVAVFIGVQEVQALDIPYGGDALMHQVRGSAHVVVGTCVGGALGQWDFSAQDTLKGVVPASFSIRTMTGEEHGVQFERGGTYLLFLQPQQRRGVFSLAMSLYSVQKIRPEQAPAFRAAVALYARNDVNKNMMMRQLYSPVPYLQYSAAIDMARLGLWSSNDVSVIGGLLEQNVVQDKNALVVLVQQLARFGTIQNASVYLEKLANNTGNPVSVRTSALEALSAIGDKEALQRIAPSVDSSDSLKLKRVFSESLEVQ